MTAADKLKIKRRQTLAYVSSEPVEITIHRPSDSPEISDGMGGVIPTPTKPDPTIAPQTVRILRARARAASWVKSQPEGSVQPPPDFVLLGAADVDVKLKDWFVALGLTFQIDKIYPDRSFQTVCDLGQLGKTARST